jgi:hypothetical protein
MVDNDKGYTEGDWKLFRKKIGPWQEDYMDRLNKEYIAILSQDTKASEKFWQLDKRIRRDKKSTGVVVDLRRSMMIIDILELLNDEVIVLEDLNDFSDILKEAIHKMYTRINR